MSLTVKIFTDPSCSIIFESLPLSSTCLPNQTVSLTCSNSKSRLDSCNLLGIQVSPTIDDGVGCRPIYYLSDKPYYIKDSCIGKSFTNTGLPRVPTIYIRENNQVDYTWLTLTSKIITYRRYFLRNFTFCWNGILFASL
jgi:hypothetical protein